MKLLHCLACDDVVALHKGWRSCLCGKSRGRYVDRENALIDGDQAIALAIGNGALKRAVSRELELRQGEVINGWGGPRKKGEPLEAWVVPNGAPTVGRPIPCQCGEHQIQGGPHTGMVQCPCGQFCYDWSMTMHCIRTIGPRQPPEDGR